MQKQDDQLVETEEFESFKGVGVWERGKETAGPFHISALRERVAGVERKQGNNQEHGPGASCGSPLGKSGGA